MLPNVNGETFTLKVEDACVRERLGFLMTVEKGGFGRWSVGRHCVRRIHGQVDQPLLTALALTTVNE
jgi:hypothetical protein